MSLSKYRAAGVHFLVYTGVTFSRLPFVRVCVDIGRLVKMNVTLRTQPHRGINERKDTGDDVVLLSGAFQGALIGLPVPAVINRLDRDTDDFRSLPLEYSHDRW